MPEQVEAVFRKMVAKKIEDRYQTMTEVIADLERCGSGQTVNPPSFAASDTGLTNFLKECRSVAGDGSPVAAGDDSQRWQQEQEQAAADRRRRAGRVILLAGLIVSLKTKDGTLIVTVNEPDAEVQVLNEEGKVEISQKGEKGKITISVDPGKHRLKVQKDGFDLFTKEFEIESGGKKSITAKLVPVEDKPAVAEAVSGGKPWDLPDFKKWMKDVAAMPAEKQIKAVVEEVGGVESGV